MADQTQVEAFLDWLISMDDPDSPEGLAARREVTLTRIIDRARAAKGKPAEPCREAEGMTGVDCGLDAGHDGPHEGWWGDDDAVELAAEHGYGSGVIRWPVPHLPEHLLRRR